MMRKTKYSRKKSSQLIVRAPVGVDGERKWVEKVPLTKEAAVHIGFVWVK